MMRTTGARFAAVLGVRGRARILIEASTESEWVAPGADLVRDVAEWDAARRFPYSRG